MELPPRHSRGADSNTMTLTPRFSRHERGTQSSIATTNYQYIYRHCLKFLFTACTLSEQPLTLSG
jgi:hypothetical protein